MCFVRVKYREYECSKSDGDRIELVFEILSPCPSRLRCKFVLEGSKSMFNYVVEDIKEVITAGAATPSCSNPVFCTVCWSAKT